MNAQEKVNRTKTVQELMHVLQEIQSELPNETTIDEVVDMGNLPVFGGEEPDNTINAWSWDDDHILTTTDGSEFYICNREEWT